MPSSRKRPLADLRDVVVPLSEVRHNALWKGLGTASLVGSFGDRAIILTARHNVEHLADEIENPHPTYPKLFQVVAVVRGPQGPFLAELVRLSISPATDIAFGLLVAPAGEMFGPALAIDPSPGRPGTTILAAGYSELAWTERNDWEAATFKARLDMRLEAREGRVIACHPGGVRQNKWPIFQVDASLDSGMSGGPILEVRGTEPIVRGVICKDMSLSADHRVGSGAAALASELWPTLLMPASLAHEYVNENGQPLSVQTVLDLIREGLILDRGNTLEDFVCETGSDSIAISWRGVPGIAVFPRAG